MQPGGDFAEANLHATVALSDLAVLAERAGFASHGRFVAEMCLILEIALWSETCVATAQDAGATQLTKRLTRITPALLDIFAAKARHAGRLPGQLSMDELHDFRKALDQMNAAVRFLGNGYPTSAVAACHKRCDAVRDIIGAASDAEVTRRLTKTLTNGRRRNLSESIAARATWPICVRRSR